MIIKILRTSTRDNGDWKPEYFNSNYARINYPDLLFKLNAIIEWKFCKWPFKSGSKTERDFEYLGKIPELKPGDIFSLLKKGNQQIIRVISENSIGIEEPVRTDIKCTKGLDDIWNEVIKAEIDLFFNTSILPTDIEIEEVDNINVPTTYNLCCQIPSTLYEIWRDKCLFGRNWLGENKYLKITYNTDLLEFPITCYMTGYRILFDPITGFEGTLYSKITYEIMCWFYNNFERLGIEEDTNSNNDVEYQYNNYAQTTEILINSSIKEDFNPNEIYYYSVTSTEGKLFLYLVRKSVWDSEGKMESTSLDPRFEEKYIPEFLELMEGIYEVPDRFKTKQEVYSYLSFISIFEFNQEFENFIMSCEDKDI